MRILYALVVGLAACGSDGPGGSSDGGALQVEAAFYPLQWLAEQVAGPDVEVDSLTPAGPNAQKIDDLLMIVLGNGMTRDVYRRGPGDGFAHAAALACASSNRA